MKLGPYEIRRELGRGSMGAVYLATRAGLDRPFALKVMTREALADREAVTRFHQEARLASRIDHPGVVAVVDVGVVEGAPYYVMTYCEGETLQARLRRGPFEPLEAAQLVRDLADAVAAAHAVGCIHRDLKPANVILDASGRPRITDFGLARDANALDRLTRTGEVLGTPAYMAPEQIRGESSIDERLDVYALGVILYECVCGSRPFQGTSSAVIAREIVGGRSTPLRSVRHDVPRGLDTIVERAMATDRAARFESAEALRGALDAFLAEATTPTKDLGRFAVRLAAFTLSFVVLTVGAVGFVVHERRAQAAKKADAPPPPPPPAPKPKPAAPPPPPKKAALDLNGRWTGVFGPHGEEEIEIRHDGESVVATKITGDTNVPAGEVTWRATLVGKSGRGEAQVAAEFHQHAQFIPGRLTVVDDDTVEFEWTALGSTIVFTRRR